MKKTFLALCFLMGSVQSAQAGRDSEYTVNGIRTWGCCPGSKTHEYIVSKEIKNFFNLFPSKMVRKECYTWNNEEDEEEQSKKKEQIRKNEKFTEIFLSGEVLVLDFWGDPNLKLVQELKYPNHPFVFQYEILNKETNEEEFITVPLNKKYIKFIDEQIAYWCAFHDEANFLKFEDYLKRTEGREQATEKIFGLLTAHKLQEINKRISNLKNNKEIFEKIVEKFKKIKEKDSDDSDSDASSLD